MGISNKLFGKPNQKSRMPAEQGVLVFFAYGSPDLSSLFNLADRVEKIISAAGVGEYDGHEIAVDGSNGVLYMYGPDADALFATVRPTLESASFLKGAQVRLQYGPPGKGVRTKNILLGS